MPVPCEYLRNHRFGRTPRTLVLEHVRSRVSATGIGIAAGALTTGAWLPQLARTWRSRSAHDLSWNYLCVFGVGVALWVVYGAYTHDVPILIWNIVSFVLIAGLTLLKAVTDRRGGRSSPPPSS
jgi:MtN3 and saliva related transmembrane protein